MNRALYTIGHSAHTFDRFISLLGQYGITAVADVRSQPYSRFNPHFNRELVKVALRDAGIAYAFLGEELGGRIEDQDCYVNGKVQYDHVASTRLFQQGLERIRNGMNTYKIALMCAEKDPLECHRTILVGRALHDEGVCILHILEDGEVESHEDLLVRLRALLKLPDVDVFRTTEEILADAYAIQAERIAYVKQDRDMPESIGRSRSVE